MVTVLTETVEKGNNLEYDHTMSLLLRLISHHYAPPVFQSCDERDVDTVAFCEQVSGYLLLTA
jgi:hypothetical protein